jgi:CBS domain-containing protein
MARRRIKLLPVVDGERLRGVISRMDILTLHVIQPRS